MANEQADIYINNTKMHMESLSVESSYVEMLGESTYRIGNYDQMPPFFMSLVSSADHWLFIASNGGLTAGRINADSALFPYETEDKIVRHNEQSGGKSIIRVARNGRVYLWEPFSERYAGVYRCERHLYKNSTGNKLIFEEINHDLQLTIRTAWRTGERFGFIRSCWLHNHGEHDCQVDLLDGLQNLLPYGASTAVQDSFSNLLDAYKRNELDPESGLGIFALSAAFTDRAAPGESLQATVAWQVGLDSTCYLLCSDQLDAFRAGRSLTPEQDVRGKAGAYFVNASFELPADHSHHWQLIADVNLDSTAIVGLKQLLRQEQETIAEKIEADVAQGTANLIRFVAAADGLQLTAHKTTTAHHFANVLFNVMRGGIFANGYQVEREDLLNFIRVRNRAVLAKYGDWLAELPAKMPVQELYQRAASTHVPDLIRLCYEYLPLTFSRRHGDPSRPWNSFSINLKKADGSPRLDYQGNWRDIFQNWEPLAITYPAYVEGLIAKFLNATTVDGYNPYRITRDGIEWEVPEPNNPWANIGYWSDHQIIYLQKLLEIADQVQPGALPKHYRRPIFSYANVPYRLRPYRQVLANWTNTIEFDWASEEATETAEATLGTDGRLLRDADGAVIHVTMTEKVLVLLLAKIANLVPGGGIWMNTQRPEWNDANNALVGKGLSVVTVAYLRRFIVFWLGQLAGMEQGSFVVNSAVASLFSEVQGILSNYQGYLEIGFSDRTRRAFMDDLGLAATAYRTAIYQDGLPASQISLEQHSLREFLLLAQGYIEHTLRSNRRPDGLAHSYNILRLVKQEAAVENLTLMLEGQVALLSSGLLAPDEALALLHSLRHSALYRADQHAYMLYPNRIPPGFLQKNNIVPAQVEGSELVAALTAAGDGRLLIRDMTGNYHFNGVFQHADDVSRVLDILARETAYADLVKVEGNFLLELFETTFNHRAFTGRSGTFFAYEGLGSIYWHMVSKLLLAAQECYQQAVDERADTAVTTGLASAYYDIRQGLSFNKSPGEYGAFPTDPYSHTPMGAGARQPGMTGQVKEEILTRLGELGVIVRQGRLCFAPTLLSSAEFLTAASEFTTIDVAGKQKTMNLLPGSLAFTAWQTPVVYERGDRAQIEVTYSGDKVVRMDGNCLDVETSRLIFSRTGQVELLRVTVEIKT